MSDFDLEETNDSIDDDDIKIDDGGMSDFDLEETNASIDDDDFKIDDDLDFTEDSFDITNDLGLEKELTLSDSFEEEDISDSLDNIDIDTSTTNEIADDYYGVALKEGPQTIITSIDLSDDEQNNLDDFDDFDT